MEWTLPETVTFGGVMLAVVFLMNRFLGQRADPQLYAILQSMITENAKAVDANEKSDNRWAEMVKSYSAALDKNTGVIDAMKTGLEMVFTGMASRLESSEGELQKIAPKLDELTQAQTAKTIQSEGHQQVMDNAITNQAQTLREILAAVQRIEAGFAEFKRDNAEKMEQFEQDVAAVKLDLGKVRVDPAPGAQPVVPATPSKTIGIPISGATKSAEIGIQIESKEDKPNV